MNIQYIKHLSIYYATATIKNRKYWTKAMTRAGAINNLLTLATK
jgi:hypothetical protein